MTVEQQIAAGEATAGGFGWWERPGTDISVLSDSSGKRACC